MTKTIVSITTLLMAAVLGAVSHHLDTHVEKLEDASTRALLSTDESEPKNKRLHWRMKLVEEYIDSTTQVRILREMYKRLDGEAWIHDGEEWSSGVPCDEQGGSTWTGIKCESDKVTLINLDGKNLIGKLPESIGRMDTLKQLDMGGNPDLKGTLPDSICDLVNLDTLNFASKDKGTAIKGKIPNCIGQLENLTYLNFRNNPNIKGPVPDSIGNLGKLELLDLRETDLTGAVPAALCANNQVNVFTDAAVDCPTECNCN